MSRRSTLTSLLAAAACSLVPVVSAPALLPAAEAAPLPGSAPAPGPGPGSGSGSGSASGPTASSDRLVVTVSDSGDPLRDGTYVLYCHPTGGSHPEAKAACDGLDEVTVWGRSPFPPVEPAANCTRIHGGPATAHVRGRWAGRPVDARFARTDGCEIDRWDRAVPLLPRIA